VYPSGAVALPQLDEAARAGQEAWELRSGYGQAGGITAHVNRVTEERARLWIYRRRAPATGGESCYRAPNTGARAARSRWGHVDLARRPLPQDVDVLKERKLEP
jgi:hypothetical protein